METIKGFKVMEPDMTCRGFKYEAGKTYVHKGNIRLCSAGFHFSEKLSDCYKFYNFDYKNKVCLVEGFGKMKKSNDKIVCEKIKIIKVLSIEEILQELNLFTSHNRGSSNSGSYNRGSSNSGSYNNGSYNSGSHNRGSSNSGSCNSGSYNSGSDNRGSHNRGSYNSGSDNRGILNFASNCVGVLNYSSFLGNKNNCYCFNVKTNLSLIQFYRKYCTVLKEIRRYNFTNAYKLPGYSPKKMNLILKYL